MLRRAVFGEVLPRGRLVRRILIPGGLAIVVGGCGAAGTRRA
jgi:hypothetical protein